MKWTNRALCTFGCDIWILQIEKVTVSYHKQYVYQPKSVPAVQGLMVHPDEPIIRCTWSLYNVATNENTHISTTAVHCQCPLCHTQGIIINYLQLLYFSIHLKENILYFRINYILVYNEKGTLITPFPKFYTCEIQTNCKTQKYVYQPTLTIKLLPP